MFSKSIENGRSNEDRGDRFVGNIGNCLLRPHVTSQETVIFIVTYKNVKYHTYNLVQCNVEALMNVFTGPK
jgi:hypothetical protein